MLPLTAEVLRHILRVLQALNPDATDPRGEWWAKIHFPLFLFPKVAWLRGRAFSRIKAACGPVAQRIERPPPKGISDTKIQRLTKKSGYESAIYCFNLFNGLRN